MGRVTSSSPMGASVTPNDLSGTISVGGTAQTLSPAKKGRQGLLIFNVSAGDLWISFTGTAAVGAAGSLKIPTGGLFETPDNFNTACSIIGATLGQAFTAWEW